MKQRVPSLRVNGTRAVVRARRVAAALLCLAAATPAQTPQLFHARGASEICQAVIEPIPMLEYDGQRVQERLELWDRTKKHLIVIPAGTQAVMNAGVGLGAFDSGSFRTAGTPYALHAIGGPTVPAALVYSFDRNAPDLTFWPQYKWSRRISEVINDNANRIVPFVQQGSQCLLLGGINLGNGNAPQNVPGAVSMGGFLPHPEENRWVLLGTKLNTAGEHWNVYHGDFVGPVYLEIFGTINQGDIHGPTFPIRVNAASYCYFTWTGGASKSLDARALGFWLNLDS